MRTSDFDYELPRELIAQHPSRRRDESRLLVVPQGGAPFEHRLFHDLPEYLAAGDLLVLNETEVVPARFLGSKRGTGGRVEMFLLEEKAPARWEVLVRPAARVRAGAVLEFGGGRITAHVVGERPGGRREVELLFEGDPDRLLEELGRVPLPPYIERDPLASDRERYQTVYARVRGAVAAPTAGLHFTEGLLASIEAKGVTVTRLVLHVGIGTFRPVSAEDPADHKMEAERYAIPGEAARAINSARTAGGRVIAVGTTVVRALESVASEDGTVSAGEGSTRLFIRPPYRFRAVDALLTNFHLPRSTLLMLVCAFAGRERVLAAYRAAVRRHYRFYSYGDAMFIPRRADPASMSA